ncbi:MAG: gamma-glutamyl-gamma-aminobutyrate hydrolase family protein [Treponema sp.]|jgi:gamma-glutamyl-gamma-aminobutyrate hydrolase PuuD|nr:gamma-glutamyl-gamma-aminobutyrate hydrolase family protein [Treponema sp.]
MKARIAISGEECVEPLGGAQVFLLSRKYASAVTKGGALPLMPADVRLADEYGDLLDALILTEGPPIHRGRYGKYYTSFEEMMKLSITRDDFEFFLFHAFSKRGKPILGIGRGMDIINVALGGTLKEDKREENLVSVSVSAGTELGSFFSALPDVRGKAITTETLSPVLRPWAQGSGGEIEGFEQPGAQVFGILWHGEWEKLILDDLVPWFVSRVKGGDH